AIVDVHERPGLLSVAPDLNFAGIGSQSYFSTDCGRRLLFASFVSAKRAVHVMKSKDASIEIVIVLIIAAQFFAEELFPSIAGLGISRICVFFAQRSDVSAQLFVARIDAGRR